MITKYINSTTLLKDEESGEDIKLEFTPAKLKGQPRDPWKEPSEQLIITERDYYQLVQLLVFYIVFPRDGFTAALNLL